MPAIHEWYIRGGDLVTLDAREWNIAPRRARLLALLPIIVAVVVAATVPFRGFYLWLVEEDSLIEWLQFACLVGAVVFLALLSVRLLRRRQVGMALLYGVVALGVLFLTGEEISWGQRIFGWGTPESLQAVNRQGETTVHNIRGIQEIVPYAMLLASLYGTCVPLWARGPQTAEALHLQPSARSPALSCAGLRIGCGLPPLPLDHLAHSHLRYFRIWRGNGVDPLFRAGNVLLVQPAQHAAAAAGPWR
ncbi:hypothetical protein QFZ60_000909 [Arthrobacter sp. B2I5]|nr:hypothetical protein [Arthrobacter sp. B2I5]